MGVLNTTAGLSKRSCLPWWSTARCAACRPQLRLVSNSSLWIFRSFCVYNCCDGNVFPALIVHFLELQRGSWVKTPQAVFIHINDEVQNSKQSFFIFKEKVHVIQTIFKPRGLIASCIRTRAAPTECFLSSLCSALSLTILDDEPNFGPICCQNLCCICPHLHLSCRPRWQMINVLMTATAEFAFSIYLHIHCLAFVPTEFRNLFHDSPSSFINGISIQLLCLHCHYCHH